MSTAQRWVVGALVVAAAASALGMFQMSQDTRNMASLSDSCVRVEQTIKKNDTPKIGEGDFIVSSKFSCPDKNHSGGWKMVGASATTSELDGKVIEIPNFKGGEMKISSSAQIKELKELQSGNLNMAGSLVNFRKNMQEVKAEQMKIANGGRTMVYAAKR